MDQQLAQPQVALPGVPAVGEVIAEKYRVEGILGVGGMGVVLSARHLQLGQIVAIKLLSVGGDKPSDSIERFLREGRAAASLNSDHVVRIYDVGQLPDGLPFMVMERLRGQDLSSVLAAAGPLPIEDAVEYVAQATMAIVEAHEAGIVHRDLKPANLFRTLRSDGIACIKVLDFGISKQLTDLDTQTMQGALTSTRQVMGSPAYMSPEQVRDAKTVDHRTDIWALGVTLYELLTQNVAFDADTLPAVCAAIAADPPVPLRLRRAEVPDVLEAIVHRCLEKQPAQRYPSARALLAALRAFQGKDCDPKLASEQRVPVTESSASLQQSQSPKDDSINQEWVESGPRSVDTKHDSSHGTLVSGRSPVAGVFPPGSAIAGVSPSRDASAPQLRRRLLMAAAALLVLIGVTTSWVFRSGSRGAPAVRTQTAILPHAAEAPVSDSPPSAQRPGETTDRSSAVAKTHFSLKIESVPSQALVLEAGNPLGVTPLTLSVDRTIVQGTPRQFVVRKEGFLEVALQQGDSLTDVHQSVTLVRGQGSSEASSGTVERRLTNGPARPQTKVVGPTASASGGVAPVPGIRFTR